MKNAWGDEVADSAVASADINAWGDPIHKPESGGILNSLAKAAGFVGKQVARISTAPISGAVEAIQNDLANGKDPELISTIKGMAKGFTNPESVQSYSKGLQRMGVSNQPVPISRTIGYIPGVTPNGDQTIPGSGMADMLGGAGEIATPIPGASLLGDAIKLGTKAVGKGVEDFGLQATRASIKPKVKLQNIPIPFDEKNLFKAYPDAPKGLASPMGKKATLENIDAFHEKLGQQQNAIMETMPKVDLGLAVDAAKQRIQEALASGGDAALGIGRGDKVALENRLNYWRQDAKDLTESKDYTWLDSPDAVDGKVAKGWRYSLAKDAKYESDASNAEKIVAATIREELNNQISQLSLEFRKIDQQFAETIPLRNALSDAVGREGNKYPIGLRTAMVLANPSSLPAEAAKIAIIEGTSRYAPGIGIKKAGAGIQKAANLPSTLPSILKTMRQVPQDSTQGQP